MRRIRRRIKEHVKEEQGAVMILMAFLIVILLGFAALAIDYGLVYYKDSQLQAAVDIAARAASRTLVDDSYSSDLEKEAAIMEQVEYYLGENGFPVDELEDYDVDIDATSGISIDAKAKVPLNFARVLIDKEIPIGASTTAVTDVQLEGGYQYIVDVVFVLDLSGSMFMGDRLDDRMVPMATAVNKAIKSILEENAENRVGIVVYSTPEQSRVLLNLTHCPTTYPYNYNQLYNDYPTNANRGYVGRTSDNSVGKFDGDLTENLERESVPIYFGFRRMGNVMHAIAGDGEYHVDQGHTYSQRGMYLASQMLIDAANDPTDNIDRTPVIFLLTDGEATWGDQDYTVASNDRNNLEHGNGDVNNFVYQCGFDTIKTAAHYKQEIQKEYEEKNGADYPTEMQMYTLGFEIAICNNPAYAHYVLNPKAAVEGSTLKNTAKGTALRSDILNARDESLYYTDVYYEAVDATALADILEDFASTVVLPTKKFKTYLTK